jgi:signal peptidase
LRVREDIFPYRLRLKKTDAKFKELWKEFDMSSIKKSDLAILIALLVIVILLKPALSAISGTQAPVAVVRGNSMLPLLHEGDLVFLHHVDPQDIKVGDIVVYKSIYGGYIIHRVIKVIETPNGFLYETKGDNNPADDSMLGQFPEGFGVSYDRIAGVVWSPANKTLIVPIIGVISLFI